MKIKKALSYLLITIILIVIISVVIIDYNVPKETEIFEFDIEIIDYFGVGFNLDKDKLHFGKVCNSCVGKRSIDIINNHKYKQRIEFSFGINNYSGDPKEVITISPFGTNIINKNETQKYKIFFNGRKISVGNHTGVIIVKTFRALPWEKQKKEKLELGICFSENILELISCGKKE